MKKLSALLILLSACVATAFADSEHEEFAQNYLPESLAVFTRLSSEIEESLSLQKSLKEDLVLFDVSPSENRAVFALSYKIRLLQGELDNWNTFLLENYLAHLAGMKTSEQLAAEDSALAKSTIAWKNSVLKDALKKGVASAYSGFMVKIPDRDYSIGECEVTQAQYESVMGNNPSRFKGKNLPVENVSWNDAMTFCKKLTERARAVGGLPAGMKYTLPTSEQWEYACRAGTTTKFYTGDSEVDLARAGWYAGNSDWRTHPVGEKEPNAWRLYDMHGNVWEWCLSVPWWRNSSFRVIRGGGLADDASYCESSLIRERATSDRNSILGFRVALVPADD